MYPNITLKDIFILVNTIFIILGLVLYFYANYIINSYLVIY